MLYLYTGQIRNGKSISMIAQAYIYYKQGFTVYSNTKLSFPYIKLTKKMLLEWEQNGTDFPPKSLVLIDEIHAWFSSRESMGSSNKIIALFITQLGKFGENKQTGLTVLGTTQFFSQLDIIGRRIVKMIIECRKINEEDDVSVTILRIYKKNENLTLKIVKKEIVKFTKEDFDLYNTQEKIYSK